MSSEETELTFVRCPSCRSLVPAVATRCRMCGFQFDGEDEVVAEAEKPKSRVRQRTVSIEQGELEASTSQEEASKGGSGSSHASFTETPTPTPTPTETEPETETKTDSEDTLLEAEPAKNGNGSDSSDSDEKSGSGKRRRRRRRRKRGGSGQDDSGSSADDSSMSADSDSDDDDDSDEAPEAVEAEPVEAPKSAEPEKFHKIEEKKTQVISREVSMAAKAGAPERAEAGAEGVLVGWFVNYEQDSNGLSIEIRSGKYFVARQRLRDDDLVIPDTAVSTPHCLVKASRKGGLEIQDLMSEQGTFLKKKGSNSFVPVKDVESVEHGDCLRLGAYEVTVCLVP